MFRKSGAVVISTFLVMIIFILGLDIEFVRAYETIYIRADGSIDPTTAPILTYDNSTYVLIDDTNCTISLEKDNIVLNGNGHNMEGPSDTSQDGIYMSARTNVTIQNLTIKGFDFGIWCEHVGYNISINENVITNNNVGALLVGVQGSIVRNNISNNSFGLRFSFGWIAEVSDNNLTGNNVGIDFNPYGGGDAIISGNNLMKNGVGISSKLSKNNISWNNMSSNDVGILLRGSPSTVNRNNFSNNGFGIVLDYGTDHYGDIYTSDHSVIAENNIASNLMGIVLNGSSYNRLNRNIISKNEYGVVLDYRPTHRASILYSRNNTITGNNITENNQFGMVFNNSSDNHVHHNNFADNVDQIFSENSICYWDEGYPSGGNFWDDYGGIDVQWGPFQNETGSDGIGDEPYIIHGNNQDDYPLMHPWGPVHNLNTTMDYWKIQDAIDAPETLDSHVILVEQGTYLERIVIEKSVALKGIDKHTTIIDGRGVDNVTCILKNNVSIENFTLRNIGGTLWARHGGIILKNVNYTSIRNNILMYNDLGICISNSCNNTIIKNTLQHNMYGVYFSGNNPPNSYNVITGNSIIDNNRGIAVNWFTMNENNRIENNSIRRNEDGINLMEYSAISDNTIIKQNNITENGCGIRIYGYHCAAINTNISENNITSNGVGISISVHSSTVHINNCCISKNGLGIGIDVSDRSTITENSIISNDNGISLTGSSSNLISGNNITNNRNGIFVSSGYFYSFSFSSDNMFIKNLITNNNQHGIYLSGAKYNTLKENIVKNNTVGICLDDTYVTIHEFSQFYYTPSNNNTLIRNTIEENTFGVQQLNSSDNDFYHNNFVSNDRQVHNNSNSHFTGDSWDNGCEGNYWNDYEGIDSIGNGVGDTPYIIDENNTDRYPLMNPYWTPCDINHNLRVDMRDLGLAAHAFDSQPGDENWNCHADITGQEHPVRDGEVSMRDIELVAEEFGEKYP